MSQERRGTVRGKQVTPLASAHWPLRWTHGATHTHTGVLSSAQECLGVGGGGGAIQALVGRQQPQWERRALQRWALHHLHVARVRLHTHTYCYTNILAERHSIHVKVFLQWCKRNRPDTVNAVAGLVPPWLWLCGYYGDDITLQSRLWRARWRYDRLR